MVATRGRLLEFFKTLARPFTLGARRLRVTRRLQFYNRTVNMEW